MGVDERLWGSTSTWLGLVEHPLSASKSKLARRRNYRQSAGGACGILSEPGRSIHKLMCSGKCLLKGQEPHRSSSLLTRMSSAASGCRVAASSCLHAFSLQSAMMMGLFACRGVGAFCLPGSQQACASPLWPATSIAGGCDMLSVAGCSRLHELFLGIRQWLPTRQEGHIGSFAWSAAVTYAASAPVPLPVHA